jgi:hypothetical protein
MLGNRQKNRSGFLLGFKTTSNHSARREAMPPAEAWLWVHKKGCKNRHPFSVSCRPNFIRTIRSILPDVPFFYNPPKGIIRLTPENAVAVGITQFSENVCSGKSGIFIFERKRHSGTIGFDFSIFNGHVEF